MLHLYSVATRVLQTQFLECDGYIRGCAVRSPVQEGDGVRVVVLVNRCDGPGPNFNALMLQKKTITIHLIHSFLTKLQDARVSEF